MSNASVSSTNDDASETIQLQQGLNSYTEIICSPLLHTESDSVASDNLVQDDGSEAHTCAFPLQDGEYIGLDDFLQHHYVHLDKKKARQQCIPPKKGESLRNGSYVPVPKPGFVPRDQTNLSSTLYSETYKCNNRAQKNSCTLRITLTVLENTQHECTAFISGCHDEHCLSAQKTRKRKRSANKPMSDRIKQILDHVLPYHTPSAALAIISMPTSAGSSESIRVE